MLTPVNHRHSAQKSTPKRHRPRRAARPSVSFAVSPLFEKHRVSGSTSAIPEPQENDENDLPSESADNFFHWDEEDTLLDDLLGQPEMSPDDEALALSNSLLDVVTRRGLRVKENIAHILIPTQNDIKSAYRAMSEEADAYGQGIAIFHKACKATHEAFVKQAELLEAYQAAQAKLERIYDQLRADYAARDALWVKLDASLNSILTPLSEGVKDTPAKIERKIDECEIKAKALEKKYSAR